MTHLAACDAIAAARATAWLASAVAQRAVCVTIVAAVHEQRASLSPPLSAVAHFCCGMAAVLPLTLPRMNETVAAPRPVVCQMDEPAASLSQQRCPQVACLLSDVAAALPSTASST